MTSPYRQRADADVRCEHCGCLLDPVLRTSDGHAYEVSYWGASVHEHRRCVELAVIRDATTKALEKGKQT